MQSKHVVTHDGEVVREVGVDCEPSLPSYVPEWSFPDIDLTKAYLTAEQILEKDF